MNLDTQAEIPPMNAAKNYAGFGVRFLALIIDGLIVMIPSLILSYLIPIFGGFIASLAYKPFFESSRLQATPGKALLGLKVETLTGERLRFRDALIRYLITFVSSAILLIGYLMVFFTDKKQTLHDKVANSVVILDPPSPTINYFECWLEEISEVLSLGKSGIIEAPKKPESTQGTASHATLSKKLKELQELYQQNLITEEEYLNKKADLLKQF